jgi:hypothetical protein
MQQQVRNAGRQLRARHATHVMRVAQADTPRGTGEQGSGTRLLPSRRRTQKTPRVAGPSWKPTPGFEPGTPSLRVKCSTS